MDKLIKPLVWELRAGTEGPYYSAFDPFFGIGVEAPDEDTCDAIDRHRTARILAAIDTDALRGLVDVSQRLGRWCADNIQPNENLNRTLADLDAALSNLKGGV
jgi:hypothetical protein